MHHPLLVARLMIRKIGSDFFKGLAQSGYVTVSKDAENSRYEPLSIAVTRNKLRGEKANDGLSGCHSNSPHLRLLSKSVNRSIIKWICDRRRGSPGHQCLATRKCRQPCRQSRSAGPMRIVDRPRVASSGSSRSRPEY